MRRMFALTGTVFMLRCVTMLITSLSVPGVHLQCEPKVRRRRRILLEDLFVFSIWLVSERSGWFYCWWDCLLVLHLLVGWVSVFPLQRWRVALIIVKFGMEEWILGLLFRDEVLAWLSVLSEVQMICIWSSWCHCHPIISCFVKIQIGLTFLVPPYLGFSGEKRLLNGCVFWSYGGWCARRESLGLIGSRYFTSFLSQHLPLPSNRHRLSNDDSLEDKRGNYQNCSVLCRVRQLCTMIRTHIWAVLKDGSWFRLRFCLCAFV